MNHGGDIYRNKVDIDFSVNLNPTGIPDDISEAIKEGVSRAGTYPDSKQESVKKSIADKEGISPECVMAGNGASELIFAAVRAIDPRNALLIEPCFSGYRYALNSLHNCDIKTYFLKKENGFKLTEGIIDLMDKDIDLIFLCDPWNPTGKNIDDDLLLSILDRAKTNDTYVILDQSFYHLSDKAQNGFDALAMLKSYDRLIILRSMTKIFALPGIRTGYVMADKEMITGIKNQLPEWNLSVISEEVIKAGAGLLSEKGFIDQSLDMIRKERTYLTDELKTLGLNVYESDTTFILIETDHELYEELLKRKILIRDLSNSYGLGRGFYRIAIKDHRSNKILIEIIREIINGH
ncbi:MAG: aminotransferase class I/II-fold pyridoxal phosphate-dependent enzyme [Lachnospiraceae bacterium]|nr:aminotransferase class I/II-fold pyridoxal phosphate-dependent enzyme [Lachnospiraceae bacterium]